MSPMPTPEYEERLRQMIRRNRALYGTPPSAALEREGVNLEGQTPERSRDARRAVGGRLSLPDPRLLDDRRTRFPHSLIVRARRLAEWLR